MDRPRGSLSERGLSFLLAGWSPDACAGFREDHQRCFSDVFPGRIHPRPYASSKGLVAQLTNTLANEWASRGINASGIAPRYFRTPLGAPLYNDPVRMQQTLQRIMAGKIGELSQQNEATVFLASQASDYVHGHLLTVDGGWLAR